jgi:hypothetical protein
MAQEEKVAPDWERIESDYRAGFLSVREIAAPQGITEGAIRKRAKKDGWERNLAGRIREKAAALVRKEAVRTEVRNNTSVLERVIVEANAELQSTITIAHRQDIQSGRRLAMSLMTELEAETGNLALFEELGDMLRSEDDKGMDRRNDLYRKVISSSGRVDSMKKLAETLKVLIGLEREAFNIGEPDKEGLGDSAALLREIVAHLPD